MPRIQMICDSCLATSGCCYVAMPDNTLRCDHYAAEPLADEFEQFVRRGREAAGIRDFRSPQAATILGDEAGREFGPTLSTNPKSTP